MVHVLAVFSLTAVLQTSLACQPGHTTMYNGWCMRFSDWFEIYDNGFKDCEKDGTHPPVITSESELFATRAEDSFDGWMEPSLRTRKFEDPNLSMSCSGDTYYAVDRKSGKWVCVKPNTLNFVDLFCQEGRPAQVGNCATHFNPIVTASGDTGLCYRSCVNVDCACVTLPYDSVEDHSVQVQPGATNWQNAENICFDDYSHLPIIHSTEVNDFLRRTGVANGFTSGFLIGQHGPDESYFSWVDGSSTDYNNFESGFPAAGFGDCAAMDVHGGKWINVDCGNNQPYLCMQEAVGRSTVAPPACPSSVFNKTGTISSPGFPWNANIPCDFFLEVDHGFNVELEAKTAKFNSDQNSIQINFIEANECCDFIDLYDGTLGGALLARVTGSNQPGTKYHTKKTNVMRVSWIPDGAVNVKGFTVKRVQP